MMLHPYIEAMQKQDNLTMDEAAIIGLMKSSLQQSREHYFTLKKWLRQENPQKLKPRELEVWATEIASYILPTCLRGI